MRATRANRAMLVLASALIALAVVECGLRIVGFGDITRRELPLEGDLPHAIAGTMAEGFRIQDFSAPRRPGVHRVAVLGDSCTFGVGVRADETMPVQLQREFDRRGVAAEVFNLGIEGMNTQQEALVARRYLPRLKPEVLLLVGSINDAEVMPWQPDPALTCGVPLSWEERADHFLLAHVYAYRPLHAAVARDGCKGPQRCVVVGGFDRDTVPSRCFRRSLDDIVAAAREAGATLYTFEYPYLPTLVGPDGGIATRTVDGQYGAYLRRAGVPFLDTRESYRGAPIAQLHLTGDRHPAALAHQRLAQNVAEFLSRSWSGQPAPASRGRVLPPGQEAAVGAMLGTGTKLPLGCAFAGAQIGDETIRATYDCPGVAPALRMELRPPGSPPGGELPRAWFASKSFVALGDAAAPQPLIDALAARIRDGEPALRWSEREQPEVDEWSDAAYRSRRRAALALATIPGLLLLGLIALARARRRRVDEPARGSD